MDSIKTEQLNILLGGIKKVVSNKNCPEWVAKALTQAVKTAKELNTEREPVPDSALREIDYTLRPYKVDDLVASNIQGDTCLYQIIGQSDPINNINLYTLKIIEGNKTNPPGSIAYNVPETMILHIKE